LLKGLSQAFTLVGVLAVDMARLEADCDLGDRCQRRKRASTGFRQEHECGTLARYETVQVGIGFDAFVQVQGRQDIRINIGIDAADQRQTGSPTVDRLHRSGESL
jgi:hypothetical protein